MPENASGEHDWAFVLKKNNINMMHDTTWAEVCRPVRYDWQLSILIPSGEMDRLPPELVHLVIGLLPAADLAEVRLVASRYNRLAVPYLVKEIHLIYRKEDFTRLQGIAALPDLADQVRTIYFEADRLPLHGPPERQYTWRPFVYDDRIRLPEPTIPTPSRSDVVPLAQRVQYYQDLHAFKTQPRHEYNNRQLSLGYLAFQTIDDTFYDFVEDLGPGGLEAGLRASAGSFRNVHTIICDSHNTFRPQSKKWKKHFGRGLTHRGDVATYTGSQAFFTMGSMSARNTASKLRTLRIGLDSWESLLLGETWPTTLASCGELRTVEMHWKTYPPSTYDGPYAEIQQCDTYLRTGIMYDFLHAVLKLEELVLCFEPDWHRRGHIPRDRSRTCYMARFDDCFRQDHWQFLTSLTLHGVESNAAELIAFFRLHSLIQTLDLKNIGLTAGPWVAVFAAIKRVGRVAFCSLKGEFYCAAPLEVWDMERPSPEGGGVFDVERERRRRCLQDWVCGKPWKAPPGTGALVEWNRIWGLSVEGVGFPLQRK